MLRFFCSLIIITTGFCVAANAQNPVSWKLEYNPKGEILARGPSFKVELTATIESPWHLYAIDQPKGGPIPTTITIPDGLAFRIKGTIESPRPIERFDENFKISTKFFENQATFTIPVDDTSGLDPRSGGLATSGRIEDLALNVRYQVCNDTLCLPPKTVKVSFAGTEDIRKNLDPLATPAVTAPTTFTPTQPPPTDLWSFIWLAVTFGAISLLTPCVFPMIPITMSYFLNRPSQIQSKGGRRESGLP